MILRLPRRAFLIRSVNNINCSCLQVPQASFSHRQACMLRMTSNSNSIEKGSLRTLTNLHSRFLALCHSLLSRTGDATLLLLNTKQKHIPETNLETQNNWETKPEVLVV